jgi:pyrimidine operon attenuation protein/uracil phosphoribosyltransferase
MTPPKTPSSETAVVPADAALILDAAAIDRALKRIAHEIIEANPDLTRVALAGIPSRGIEIARRLTAHLATFSGVAVFCGIVDVSMHRDDLATRRRLWPVQVTTLPHDLSDQTIVLVDDVLFSGRTCRAAMDAISSFGRPARIQYAALVDRGHRELPIRADYVGKNLPTAHGERVFVRFEPVDGVADSVWLDRGGSKS